MSRRLLTLVGASLVVLEACTGPSRESSEPPTTPFAPPEPSDDATAPVRISGPATLATAIADEGFLIEATDKPRGLPWREVEGEPHGFQIGDDENLTVFEYPSAHALTKMVSTIHPRGDLLPADDGGTISIQWGKPPSLYTHGRILTLYFGNNPAVRRTLADLLGKPH